MPSAPRPPWHTAPVGLLAALFYLAGAADYLLRRVGPEAYLSAYPQDWSGLFAVLPTWISAGWALAVWAGLLGGVLLLRRDATAVLPLAIAFLALAVVLPSALMVPELPVTVPGGIPTLWAFAAIIAVAALLWLYGRAQKTGGHIG